MATNTVKTKISKKNTTYDVEVLVEAVEAVKSKRMGLRKAASHYKIALSTLADKVKGKTPIKPQPRTLFTPDEEKRLFAWLIKMSQLGFGQTTDDIRAKGKMVLELRGATTKDGTSMPSTAWVYRFFERHPQLSLRTPMSLGKERALVTPPNVEKWFTGLRTFLDSKDPSLITDPTRIFNADESGFSFDPKQRKVIAWKGVKNVYNIASNTKTQVTVLAAMNAAGFYLPPLLIYPYKRVPGKDLMNGFPEALLQVSDNGWITSAIFFTWLRDSFIPATQHIQKPLLLLVDGHVSHTSLIETSEICEENGIILYCLLAHASHLIQPLDQAFFCSIKSAWSSASRQHIADTGDAVGLVSFAKVFQTVWQKCTTMENSESSYRAAGIFPLSPERVLNTRKMDPCQVYRDLPSSTSSKSSDQARPSTHNPSPPLTPNQVPMPSHVDDGEPEPPLPFLLPSDSEEEPSPPAPFELPAELLELEEPQPAAVQLPMDKEEDYYETALPPLEDIMEVEDNSASSSQLLPAPSSSSQLILSPSNPLSATTPAPTPISGNSPLSSTSAASPFPEETSFSGKQLEAMKNFALFITDDLGRNGFLRCFQALSKDATESHEGFNKFKSLASSLKSAFEKEKVPTQSRAPLTLDDILRVPSFSGKGKGKKTKKAPTMQYVLSGAEHREAILLKEEKKKREEKEKLVKKTAREERSRQLKENKEQMRLKREKAKEEKQQQAGAPKTRAAAPTTGKKNQALLEKLEREGQRKRKYSESEEDNDERVEKEMEQTMREADEDD